jgi:hypothetical protein
MVVTVNIPDERVVQASARGVSLEAYVQGILAQQLVPPEQTRQTRRQEEIRISLDSPAQFFPHQEAVIGVWEELDCLCRLSADSTGWTPVLPINSHQKSFFFASSRIGWPTLLLWRKPASRHERFSSSNLETGGSVLQANAQLTIGFFDRPDGVHAMTAEVVGGVFQMLLGSVQCAERVVNFGVPFKSRRRRGQRKHHRDHDKRTH